MKTSFSRSFSTTATILLLALIILGTSFQLQVKKYLTDATIDGLQQDADVIANLAASYSVDGSLSSREFLLNLDVISQVSDADAVICDSNGYVILCSHARSGCNHEGMQLNQDYLHKVIENGGDIATGVIKDYTGFRYVVSVPIYNNRTIQNRHRLHLYQRHHTDSEQDLEYFPYRCSVCGAGFGPCGHCLCPAGDQTPEGHG